MDGVGIVLRCAADRVHKLIPDQRPERNFDLFFNGGNNEIIAGDRVVGTAVHRTEELHSAKASFS